MDEATYKARYWRYSSRAEKECDTLDEAVAFLASGSDRGELAPVDVIGPNGVVALDGDELHRRIWAYLGV